MNIFFKLCLFTLLSIGLIFAQAPTNKPNNQPEIVVKEFYTWYIPCSLGKGQLVCLKTNISKQYVSKPLASKIINNSELDYDFIVSGNDIDDAKDVLPTIKTKLQSIDGNKSTVFLTFRQFKKSPLAKRLISLTKGKRLMENYRC